MEILLVEDDYADVTAFTRDLYSSHLSKQFVVGVCHTLKEAQEVLRDGRADIVLLDLNLPGTSELEGFKVLVEEFPEIPIVIHSGTYSPQIASEAIALGAQDYIVKGTMEVDDLARTLLHAKIRHDVLRRLHRLSMAQ